MKEFPNIEKYLPKDSLDYQRLVHFQEVAKANGYAKGHLWMAGLAAFPVFLTPDLLHKVWLNFRHISYQNGQSLDIDRMAVSDLLLSSLVEEVAVEVLKIRPQIRTALLALLEEWAAFTKDGDSLVRRLADFTLRYVRSYQMEGESVTTAIREAQEWNALAYFNPNAAALELKKALSQAVESHAKQKVLRISLMLSEMDEHFTQLGQQEQQDQFRTLVNYSQGMKALIRGEKAQAVEAFKNIDRQAIAPSEGATTGKRVQLPIPKEIYQAIAVESTGKSNSDAGQIFALLVGIAEYKNVEVGPSPSGVPRDLEFWQDFFSNQVEGEVQINSLLNGAATKTAVLEAIKLECRKATAGSQVFFFFSGLGENKAHGREEAAILLHDHDTESNTGRLLESEFREQVVAFLPEGAEITVVLDTSSGGKNWINTDKTGRYIYNATDIDQGAQESPDGGLLTRAFRQALSDVGASYFTHLGLMQRLRSLMPSLSNGNEQTATWYGRRDRQVTAFLNLPAPSHLRLRELMVDTGLARSVSNVDVQAVLQQFRSDHSIPEHLSVEKALEIWAASNNKSFRVFISQSGQNLSLQSYLEDLLLDKNIPHEIFTHDLQREMELQMQKARPIAENDWSVQLVEADFVLLQIDEAWIKDSLSQEVTALLQLRLMETQVPYELIYASTCDWGSHPVSQLGEAWPADSITTVYATKEEQAFVADFRKQLASPIDYIECFLANASSEIGINMLQEQFISALLEEVGRYHPEEVAQLSIENRGQAEQIAFLQNCYPAPIGQAIAYLLQSRAHSEQLKASYEVWFMLVHTLNTFLLALLRQLVKRNRDELKEVLVELDSATRIEIQDWLSGPSASLLYLEAVQAVQQLPNLLEELGVHPETWRQLTKGDLPPPASDRVSLAVTDTDYGRQVQSALSSNYSNLKQWFKRLEVLINLKWENICQLYSAETYTPILFHEQGLNPFSEELSFYRFSHQVYEGQQLHFRNLEGKIRIIEQGSADSGPIWEGFQELFQLFGRKKTIPAHPEQVHALLVGINDYPASLPSLRAPENDTLRFKAYLDQQPLEAQTEMLSGAVTKSNIIETLTKLVGQAAPGDAVIFYFSGLGQKEQSPRLNDTIPAILTYDQQRIPIDEIVYLLCQDKEKVLQPIIILDIGVNANISEEHRAAGLRPKGIDAVGTARDWSNYQFGHQIQSMEAWGAFMQEASFVLMVGCDYDNESGLEDEQESFFTRNLIEVLSRSRHFLPYPVLQERLAEVLSHQVPQTPDIRVEGPSESMSSPNFLGQPSIDFQPMYGRVKWNLRLQQWTIDMGSRFGVNKQQIVHLCSTEYKGNALARISFVYDDYSTLAFGDQLPDRSKNYLGYIDEFLQTEPLRLAILGYEEEINRAYMMELGGAFPGLEFREEQEADFVLQAEEGGFSIRPGEIKEGSIYQNTEAELKPPFGGIATQIRKIGQAKALISLSSNDPTQDPFAVDLEVELLQIDDDEQTELLKSTNSSSTSAQHYQVDFDQLKRFQIQVKNQSKGRRFLAILLVRNDLGISTLVHGDVTQSIQPGETIKSRTWRAVLPIMQEGIDETNFQHIVKIIASDQAFTPAYWLQSGLSIPNQKVGSSQFTEGTNLSLHDNLWSISTLRIDSGLNRPPEMSIDAFKKLLNDNKIDELLDTLFSIIPEEENLFQQLVATGSRFNEVQRMKIRQTADDTPIAIQEGRIVQSLSNILSSKKLQELLATGGAEVDKAVSSARQGWHKTLLKQGILEALKALPSSPEKDPSARQALTQIREAATTNSMNFTGMRVTVEEYMVEYSRQLAQLNNWIASFASEIWTGTNVSLEKEPQEEWPIENWEERKQQIKEMVANADLGQALQELRGIFHRHPQTQLLLLQEASFSQVITDFNTGLIPQEQVQLYQNRTALAIINFMDLPNLLTPQNDLVDWDGKLQTRLLAPFLKGNLDQSTADLIEVLGNQKEALQEAIPLRSNFLQLEANRKLGILSEEDYRQDWSNIANSFLDIVRELPPDVGAKPETETPQEPPLSIPADLTLTIDRQQQYDHFAKAISEKEERLQVFFVPAPPKSEPQHFLKRLAWHIKPNENTEAITWDPIFINSDTPLHQLSSQLEKAWEQRWRADQLTTPNQMLISMQFDPDWFENREALAAWLASEGSKRMEKIRVKQLIAVIILEVPEVNSRNAIGRLLRGDPLTRQLDWLESVVGEYDNATILATLNKVSLDDIDDWLRILAGVKQAQGTNLDIGELRNLLTNGNILEVIELLQNEASLTEEDRLRISRIGSGFKNTERGRNLAILNSAQIQAQQNRTVLQLLPLLDDLEKNSEFGQYGAFRQKILQQLQSSFGKSADGYHMENIIEVITQSDPLPSKSSPQSMTAGEAHSWEQASHEGNLKAYQDYLSQYPNGFNSNQARLLIQRHNSIELVTVPLDEISSTKYYRTYKMELKIQADIAEIQSIQSVTYSYGQVAKGTSSAKTNFAITIEAQANYGNILSIHATIQFKDGTQIRVHKDQKF